MCVTKIVLAMNVEGERGAIDLLSRIGSKVDVYKIGIDLFTRTGPELVREFVRRGVDVFLDLKYSDIPSVVGKAVEAASELNVAMLTVHTMGGPKMLLQAATAANKAKGKRPLILGVTVLTSLDQAALEKISGSKEAVADRVRSLAAMAKESGCDGVVASPHETGIVKEVCGRGFTVVTPGIRLGQSKGADDQARTLTPAEAAKAGADYIVVGRPIYEAPDPNAAIAEIRAQLMHVVGG